MASLPSTIKAATIPKQGGADLIEITSQPFPKQQPGHLIVKVQYGGVNFIDTYQRGGVYPVKTFPYILGNEASGAVVGLPNDTETLANEDYKQKNFAVSTRVIVRTANAFAEYLSVPWLAAVPIPDDIPTKTAGAAATQALTALTFITESYNVQKNDTVLIHTVAGGLGLCFAQLCKARGAIVIGTTSSPEKAELAKAHGADHVILYNKEDTVQRVLEITAGQGVHVIYDGVGKDTFESDFKMIRRKGTIVSVGNASGVVPPFPPLKLTEKNIKLLRPSVYNYMATPPEITTYTSEMFKLLRDGTIKINIHKHYPFTEEGVRQAHEDIVSRKTTGKLVVDISPESNIPESHI